MSTAEPTSSTLNPQVSRAKLVRRADSRTDAMRMKELERLMGPDTSKVVDSELETLKMYAKVDDPSMDQSTIVLKRDEIQNPTSPLALEEINHENASTSNLDLQRKSPSPPFVKPLLKRKVRDRGELDVDKYMPFLTEDVIETSTSVEQEALQHDTNTFSAKRQKLSNPSLPHLKNTDAPTEDLSVEKIEGPVTKILKAAAESARNDSKRKAFVGLSADEEQQPSQAGKRLRKSKRGRIDEQTRLKEDEPASSNPKVTKRNTDALVKSKRETRYNDDLGSGGKTKSKSAKDYLKETSRGKEEDSASVFLNVETTGKRLTTQEMQSNLEFNRLQISKAPAPLKHKPIPTQRIGWDEEDRSEDELREMDGWGPVKATKSFFKVKYVNLVKKQRPSIWQDSANETQITINHAPNFKKFRPKTRGIEQISATPSHPCRRGSAIKMETVHLNECSADRERSRTAVQPTSTRASKQLQDEAEGRRQRQGSIRIAKTQEVTSTNKSTKSQATSSKHGHPHSDSSDSSFYEFKHRRTSPIVNHLDDEALSPKQPTAVGSKNSILSTRTPKTQARTQINQNNRSRSKPLKNTLSSDPVSSDGDELAFKGFGRRR